MIDMAAPVNWLAPLNRGLVSWHIVLPGMGKSATWWDIVQRRASLLTNMAPLTDWAHNKPRPGGFGALDFDNTNDFINCGSHHSLGNLSPLTWTAWVNPRTIGESSSFGGVVVSKATDGTAFRSMGLYGVVANSLVAEIQGVTTDYRAISSANIVQFNQWQQIGMTFSLDLASPISVWWNGRDVTNTVTGAGGVAGDDSAENLQIGAYRTGQFAFDGQIDDVRIYRRRLTDGEMLLLHNASKTGYANELRRVPAEVGDV